MNSGGMLGLAGVVVCGVASCGDRPPITSSDGGADGGGTATEESTAADATGELVCGDDGIARGLFLIRENRDALELRACHTIEGDLVIDPCQTCADPNRNCEDCEDAAMLTSLEGLEAIREVTGSVAVGWDRDVRVEDENWSGPTALSSLSSLSQLERVGQDVRLDAAPNVQAVVFDRLQSIGGELRVSGALPVDPSFPSLERVGRLSVAGIARRTLVFPQLSIIDGPAWIRGTGLSDLRGLEQVESVTGRLDLEENEMLSAVNWSQLPSVAGFDLVGSPGISRVDLSSFQPPSVYLEGNASLTLVDGRGLETMSGLSMIDLPLTEADFSDLREVEYDFVIWGTTLSDLSGFANLERARGRLWITDNPNLCQSEVDAFVERVHASDEPYMADGNADC